MSGIDCRHCIHCTHCTLYTLHTRNTAHKNLTLRNCSFESENPDFGKVKIASGKSSQFGYLSTSGAVVEVKDWSWWRRTVLLIKLLLTKLLLTV